MFVRTERELAYVYTGKDKRAAYLDKTTVNKPKILRTDHLTLCKNCSFPKPYRLRRSFKCYTKGCGQQEIRFKSFAIHLFATTKYVNVENPNRSQPFYPLRIPPHIFPTTVGTRVFVNTDTIARVTLELLCRSVTAKEQRKWLDAKVDDLIFLAYKQVEQNFEASLAKKCTAALNRAFVQQWFKGKQALVQYRPTWGEFVDWLEKLTWVQKVRDQVTQPRKEHVADLAVIELNRFLPAPTINKILKYY